MTRITFQIVSIVFFAFVTGGSLFAQPHVVVAAGVFEDGRTGHQFEFALAAAADGGVSASNGIMALRTVTQLQAQQGDVESIEAVAEQIAFFIEDGIPVRADIMATADVKLHRGRQLRDLPARFVVSESSVSVVVTDPRDGLLYFGTDGGIISGRTRIEQFAPSLLVICLGEATEVPTDFQAAAAIAEDGRAIGNLSLLANRDDGDLIHVEGDVDFAALRSNNGGGRPQLLLMGAGGVDVVRPDGTSPDICFGEFSFLANEGPHGPYRLEMPDCRDPLAGIEGSDIGTGGVNVTAASTSPLPRRRDR